MTSQDKHYEVVSRHTTSEGVLVYLRSPSGDLQARLYRWTGGDQVLIDHRTAAPSARFA
jgi:hypothetical protein